MLKMLVIVIVRVAVVVWDHHVLYWLAPIAGGVCASLLYHHFLLKTDDAPVVEG
jgi:glycerol uptake facilitator-like aquaporin